MQQEHQLRQLARILPPKQQTLDFAKAKLWERLPNGDQQACRIALARLLYHVLRPTQKEADHE